MLKKLFALRNHHGFIRYFTNTGWMMGEQALRMAAGLLVGVWVARYLGPEQFGIFSYALAFTSIFAVIAKLGMDSIMVRELIHHPEQHEVYLGTAFWLKIVGSAIVMLLLVIITSFTSNDTTTNLYIYVMATGGIFQSFEVIEFYFQSQVLAKIVSICKIIQLVLSSAAKIYLVLTFAELFWFVLVIAFDALSLAISYFISYRIRNKSSFYFFYNIEIAKKLLHNSWPLMLSSLTIMLYIKIDQIMIHYLLGEKNTGIYSSAVKIVEILNFIPTIISTSTFPSLLHNKKIDSKIYNQRLAILYGSLIWLAIFMALIINLNSSKIITFLYGKNFQGAENILSIYIWTSPFTFLLFASGKWFIIENLIYLALYRNVLALLFNIILNIILIPSYGAIGAAYSAISSLFISSYLFDLSSKLTMNQFLLKSKSIILFPLFITK